MANYTAGYIVTQALRRLSVIDAAENPTDLQMGQGVQVLSDLVRHEFIDATCNFQIVRLNFIQPAAQQSFSIGVGKGFNIQADAKYVDTIYNGNAGNTRFELKRAPATRVFTVSASGTLAVRFYAQEQPDGSIIVYLWPTPAQDLPLLISLGLRPPVMVAASDPFMIPPDSAVSTIDLLASRLRATYGVAAADVADVIANAATLERQWKAANRSSDFVRLRRRRP